MYFLLEIMQFGSDLQVSNENLCSDLYIDCLNIVLFTAFKPARCEKSDERLFFIR